MFQHNNFGKSGERGQVIVIITIGLIVLTAFAGLSIDASRIFAERRKVQNVTDNSGLAGALALCKGEDVVNAVMTLAALNGYDNNGTTNTVTVHNPPATGQYTGNSTYVEVEITSTIEPTVIQLVYSGDLTATARSVGQCNTIVNTLDAEGFPDLPYALLAGASTCSVPTIEISGNAHDMLGPIHANGDWKLSGNANTTGDITFAGDNLETGSPNWFDSGPTDNDTVLPWPLTHAVFNIVNYQPGGAYADAAGSKYYYKDSEPWIFDDNNSTIPDGLYYSNAGIVVSGNNVTGKVTFVVGGTGIIHLEANHSQFEPFMNNLLAFSMGDECTSASIHLEGNHPVWKGIIYTPNGMIYVDGDAGSTVDGCLWGASIRFVKNTYIVQNCDKYMPNSTTLQVNLAE